MFLIAAVKDGVILFVYYSFACSTYLLYGSDVHLIWV